MNPLFSCLLDLLRKFDSLSVPLTIGGGFGLYLKRCFLERTGERILFSELPDIRSTNDLDVFLRADVLADFARTRDVAGAISGLGYRPVETAKYLQWERPIKIGVIPQVVKIDFLVGPLGRYRPYLKVKPPRARPKKLIAFHAHMVEEALHLEDQPMGLPIEGSTSDGDTYCGTVYVPEAFPYLMMKLHAFHDRRTDQEKDLGRHHALDVYTIVGMMLEEEFERAKKLGRADRDEQRVAKARLIVSQDFSSLTAPGILRIREHALFRDSLMLDDLVSVLAEIFAV